MVGTAVSFHRLILYVNAALSTFGNGLLIYLIAYHTKAKLGQYRHLMTIFAVFEMVYSFVHVLICMEFHMQDHIWLGVYNGVFREYLGRRVQSALSIVFCGVFSQSLALLAFHFLYRYISVCKRNLLYIFERGRSVMLLVTVYFVVPIVWYIVCFVCYGMTQEKDEYAAEAFLRIYNTSIYEHGYHGPLYKNADGWIARDCIGMLILLTILTIASSACITFAFLTQRAIDSVAISTASRSLQKQLFKVLIFQTLFPLCTAHLPVGVIFLGPLFGWNSEINIGYFNSLMLSIFPVVDPFIMIYFMRDYRNGVKYLLFRLSGNEKFAVEPTVTANAHTSDRGSRSGASASAVFSQTGAHTTDKRNRSGSAVASAGGEKYTCP